MTYEEARQIEAGTRVMWDNDLEDLGTVRVLGFGGFAVRWDNGEDAWYAFSQAQPITVVEEQHA